MEKVPLGFSRDHVRINVCDLHGGKYGTPVGPLLEADRVLLESFVHNVSRNKRRSFNIPLTLWVYGKKVQTVALVDSGATTNFISKQFVETNHLVTNRLRHTYEIKNADGTPNLSGTINSYVRAYMEIGDHKTTNYLYVTDLGDKDMMIGYTFLHDHNPDIDWEKGEWRFTRCPETCADRLRKSRRVYESDELELDDDASS